MSTPAERLKQARQGAGLVSAADGAARRGAVQGGPNEIL